MSLQLKTNTNGTVLPPSGGTAGGMILFLSRLENIKICVCLNIQFDTSFAQ